jgi:carboxyl-terminal processing protease
MSARAAWITGVAIAAAAGLLWIGRSAPPRAPHDPAMTTPAVAGPSSAHEVHEPHDDAAAALSDDARAHSFRIPSGHAPSLSCEAARAIVGQVRGQLGYAPDHIDPSAFVDAAVDWLDPYGLWSVAPDAAVRDAFKRKASELIAALEGRGGRDCEAAHVVGAAIVPWVAGLRVVFDEARGRGGCGEGAATAAAAPAFEGATVIKPARVLAESLGQRIGAIEHDLGTVARPYGDAARARYFPEASASEWAEVVLAAAVRAYVPAIDPHGAWAPLDEESSVYEVDLEAHPPLRLWDKAERTAIGLKIETGATPPLADGDVLLSLAGTSTAGLSYEQTEQLGFAASDARPPAQAIVLRVGERMPITAWLDESTEGPKAPAPTSDDEDELPVERIEYGDGDTVVVTIHDVRDDLGEELTRALLRERERVGRSIEGVVLDVRGNGGGSTDGAIDALGLFIPGAPLFPMKRRDGSLETDRAPEPPGIDRWRGPVATLIDGDTASAAEMIAGALTAYHRGPSIGSTTFGKGCAQEYLDDEAQAGVVRLTTLLYALPDGTPVQRVGLSPTFRFPFGVVDPSDREAVLPHAPPTWRGPDVRDRSVLAHAEDGTWTPGWPQHGGNVGPCKEPEVCRALRLLGANGATARRWPTAKGR